VVSVAAASLVAAAVLAFGLWRRGFFGAVLAFEVVVDEFVFWAATMPALISAIVTTIPKAKTQVVFFLTILLLC